jgi:hypothetical protein
LTRLVSDQKPGTHPQTCEAAPYSRTMPERFVPINACAGHNMRSLRSKVLKDGFCHAMCEQSLAASGDTNAKMLILQRRSRSGNELNDKLSGTGRIADLYSDFGVQRISECLRSSKYKVDFSATGRGLRTAKCRQIR